MKLYQYDDIKKLNQALGSFSKNNILVEKVELQSIGDKIQYFVLADQKEVVLGASKVLSRTEESAKKSIQKEKKLVEDKAIK